MSSEQKVLGNCKKGLTFVISAPAGTGKTTLVEMLKREFSCVRTTISYTTRAKRPQEVHGIDYYFVSVDEFEKKSKNGDFIEEVTLFSHRYGTAREEIERLQKEGFHVVLVIDTQGVQLLKKKCELVCIFIAPPSLSELSKRLIERKTENIEELKKRLDIARQEIETASTYDYLIVNDNLYVSYQVLRSIFIAEEHKTRNIEVTTLLNNQIMSK